MTLSQFVKNIIRSSLPVLFLVLFSLFICSALFKPFWPKSHDGINHVIRIKDFFHELTAGQIPVRWVDHLDYEYGLPLFTYVYPGPYLLSSVPMALGFSAADSYKIIMLAGYLLGVIGMYALFAKKNTLFALAAAVLFGLTPYMLLDVFVRGALAEVVSIGFMPWVLYALGARKHALGAISLCFVLISHNYFGIFFLLFLLLYLAWNGLFDQKVGKMILLGVGLSAFFIIPMILESRYIDSGFGNGYLFSYQDHFVYPLQLLYSKWGFGYSVPGPGDGMSFQLGFANILIIAGSLLAWVRAKRRKYLSFLLAAVLGSTFLTLTYSRFIWDKITILHGLTVFPWRLLFVSALLCPLLFYESITRLHKRYPSLAYVATIALVMLAAVNVRNYRQATEYMPLERFERLAASDGQKTTTFAREEVAPVWSKAAKSNGNRVIDAQTRKEVPSVIKPGSMQFTIKSETQRVTILKNYFPGWKLKDFATGKNIAIQPDEEGNITASLLAGRYAYVYGQTAVEIAANVISCVSLLIYFLLIFKINMKHMW